ncbi:probable palmitoyltransferase ZDHHC24 isoform X2 [Ceratitis capitata]|uniref:probable palmitoyltransferase ZDHHC24 isoform X2 n=1 Tax=Ceratitis capitata TaxID=7213 RepID=UPI000A102C9E|nr:probable palmitoyltransferase ZDHHC24 isoform X2 [Ceratitis capitata]
MAGNKQERTTEIRVLVIKLSCEAIFIYANIHGNMFAVMMVDTSIKAIDLNSKATTHDYRSRGFHFCRKCLSVKPPRSFHCQVCNKCILKYSHHCVFTGCCIGHYNVRHYFIFLVYLFIGSVLSLGYLSYFMFWVCAETFRHRLIFFKFLNPFWYTTHKNLWNYITVLFFDMNVVALVITSILLIHYGVPIFKASTAFERRVNYPFRKGLTANLRSVFGKRYILVWFSAFLDSDLTLDGANWDVEEEAVPLQRQSRQRYRKHRRRRGRYT